MTNIPNVIDDMPAYERYGFAFDIDQWYPSCKAFTIPTQFICVSPSQAKIICKIYDFQVKKQQSQALTPVEYDEFKKLEETIDTILREHFYNEEDDTAAAFVRLSGRSPKDAVFDTDRIKQIMKRKLYEQQYRLKKLHAQEQLDMVQNSEFIAFFETQAECMKISSGQEALELITNSLRVYEDLNASLTYNLDKWNVQIVLRQWIEGHDIGLEFRGFVFNRNLTAISQYFEPLYYEQLTSKKQMYLNLMNKFFESIKGQLPWDNCVCDFLITRKPECTNEDEDEEYKDNDEKEYAKDENDQIPEEHVEDKVPTQNTDVEENYNVQVLEFNPFNRFTSAALFDWNTDRELFEGKKSFEFRVLQRPLPVLRENFGVSSIASLGSNNLLSSINAFEGGNSDEVNEAMFLLTMPEMNENILNEQSNVINLVKEVMQDDVQRINSNLRYVMQKLTKEKLLKLSQQQ